LIFFGKNGLCISVTFSSRSDKTAAIGNKGVEQIASNLAWACKVTGITVRPVAWQRINKIPDIDRGNQITRRDQGLKTRNM
jgi:hypothetical protein